MSRHGWTVGLVGVVFAAGLSSGLLFPKSQASVSSDHEISLGDAADDADSGQAELIIASSPAIPRSLERAAAGSICPSGEQSLCPRPGDGPFVELHPPQFALHLQASDDRERTAVPAGEGPQLHPPDLPSARGTSPKLPPGTGPELPRRTAENDPAFSPGRLAHPPDAARVPADGADGADRADALLKAMIRQELPDVSADEREVWLDRIRGMDPVSARYLLELRRRVGSAAEEAMRKPAGEPRPLHSDLANRPSHLPPPSWPKPIKEAQPQIEEDPSEFDNLPPQPEMADPLADESVITRPLATAMMAVRQARGVVVHNLANARTDGFKRMTVELVDAGYSKIRRHADVAPETPLEDDEAPGYDAVFGDGCQVRTSIDFSQGPIRRTGRALDVAVEGEGWIQVQLGQEIGYTRCGRLNVNASGEIVRRVHGREFRIEPTVVVPSDTTKIVISEDGGIAAEQPGKADALRIGQLQLARFVGDQTLAPSGCGLFKQDKGPGPLVGSPGEAGCGKVRQGCLEGSNVDMKAELDELRKLSSMSKALVEAVRLMQDDSSEGSDDEDPEVFRMSQSNGGSRCRDLDACEECPHCRKSPDAAGRPCCSERGCKEDKCCPKCSKHDSAETECPDDCLAR